MGNSMIMKPAGITPITTLEIARLTKEAGLPDGVFNVVTGPGSTIGNALTSHPLVDKISLTGSTEVGRQVYHNCADTIKKITLELGGKSPLIILDDADLVLPSTPLFRRFCSTKGRYAYPEPVYLYLEKCRTLW